VAAVSEAMHLSDIKRQYAYSRWATARLLAAAENLSSNELHKQHGTSFGSLHGTLDHLYGAERVWLDRWKGSSPTARPSVGPTASPLDFAAAWEKIWTEQNEFLADLAEQSLDRELVYRDLRGAAAHATMGDVLFQVANHATYHRGQIASLLRQSGINPPATDFLVFARDAAPVSVAPAQPATIGARARKTHRWLLRGVGSATIVSGGASLIVALAAATKGGMVWGSWHYALPLLAAPIFAATGIGSLFAGALMRRRGVFGAGGPAEPAVELETPRRRISR
jgi:uncharacterized damage-inducible protein DinB